MFLSEDNCTGGRELKLDEQQVWAKFGASVLLSTLNLLTSAFYFPHAYLPSLTVSNGVDVKYSCSRNNINQGGVLRPA